MAGSEWTRLREAWAKLGASIRAALAQELLSWALRADSAGVCDVFRAGNMAATVRYLRQNGHHAAADLLDRRSRP